MSEPIDVLTRLQSCFCAALATSIGGSPSQCCLVSGPPVIADCCSGVAWVRVVSIYPTRAFPALDQTPDRCVAPTQAMVVELGIERCAPPICDPMGNPCCASEADAANILLGDFKAMQTALICCMPVKDYTGPAMDQIIMGPWIVGDPEGGCVRSTMTATIQIDTCVSC